MEINAKRFCVMTIIAVVKHFFPDGSGIFQHHNASVQTAGGSTEWFDEM